jgi:predicted TIM-barrel fold metal-dependent hydrolase
MESRSYRIVSADSHVVEPHDLWQRYIDPAFRERAPRLVRGAEFDRLVGEEIDNEAIGLLAGCLRKDDEVRPHGRWDEDVFPGGYDPRQRLRDLDVDGIDAEVLFPTIALAFYPVTDLGFLWALFRAYNSWLADFCGTSPDRLKGIALLNHADVDVAVKELERARSLGLVGAMLPLFPAEGSTYRDAELDPLWAAAASLGMPIHLHSSTWRSKDRSFFNVASGTDRLLNTPNQIQHVVLDIIFSGVFDRHPSLRIVSVENDAGWAPFLAERGDYWWHRHRRIMPEGEIVCVEPPSSYFRDNVRLTFMRDRAAVLARELIGAPALLWGNDFPHHISTWPHSHDLIDEYRKELEPTEHALIFCDNARSLYGI